MITDAFEGFAHALRILPEVVYRAYELVRIDAHEATGNIEHALTSVLNAFHSVYDSAREDSRISFDWYGVPETAAILAVRNARIIILRAGCADCLRIIFRRHSLKDRVPTSWLIARRQRIAEPQWRFRFRGTTSVQC